MLGSGLSAMVQLALEQSLDRSNEKVDWEYVESEYNLIGLKKSKLSRKERMWIIKTWEGENEK